MKSGAKPGTLSSFFAKTTAPTAKLSKAKRLEMIQLALLTRSVVVTILYFTCWMPFLVYFIVLASTRVDDQPWLDIVSTWMSVLNAVLNPLVFIMTDARVKRSLFGFFRSKARLESR